MTIDTPLQTLRAALRSLCTLPDDPDPSLHGHPGGCPCESRVQLFRQAWDQVRDLPHPGLEAAQALSIAKLDLALHRCCEQLRAGGHCGHQALAHPLWIDVRARAGRALALLGTSTGPCSV